MHFSEYIRVAKQCVTDSTENLLLSERKRPGVGESGEGSQPCGSRWKADLGDYHDVIHTACQIVIYTQ